MLIDVDEVIRLYVDCLEDIYALHRKEDLPEGLRPWCVECAHQWPCKTVRMVASVR